MTRADPVFHWFLPTGRDDRAVRPAGPDRTGAGRPDGEFLTVLREASRGVPFDHDGDHCTVDGGHGEVAERIAGYRAVGIDEFIMSGYPHLEEAYAFAEGVLPAFR